MGKKGKQMREYVVWQKAIVWYQTTSVQSDNPEQAIQIAKEDTSLDWEIDLETTELLDNWEVYDEEDNLVFQNKE